jgi:hypothetical protein
MSEVDRLLTAYIEEHRAGGDADPRAYIANARTPADRAELAAMIDGYLARVPRQAFDPQGFSGSVAERTVEELQRAIGGDAGLWPAMLPSLRARAGLKRSEVVKRLAASLGVADRRPKVELYYHQMEQGLLPAEGVSGRVLEALSLIVGETPQSLREAGRSLRQAAGGGGAAGAPAAFARRSYPAAPPGAVASSAASGAEGWDEVDLLFRGG